jgi:uncharacterized protein YcbX
MDAPHLAQIWTYPVKSLGGGAHDAEAVEPWGLQGDRRWLVVDAAGTFLTQREHPRMALVHAAISYRQLTLSAPGMGDLTVSPVSGGAPCQVRIWRDTVAAQDCGDNAASWLSAALDLPCRLAHLADTGARKLKPAVAVNGSESVSFADGFPVLLTSEASLGDLNARLAQTVPMTRFRTNLVIAGAPPWAEDGWRRMRIGGAVFRVVKPCDRCIMTTRDPLTGTQPDGNEPLLTLARFRRDVSGGIMFGQNLVPDSFGTIRVGDPVTILDRGAANVTLGGEFR